MQTYSPAAIDCRILPTFWNRLKAEDNQAVIRYKFPVDIRRQGDAMSTQHTHCTLGQTKPFIRLIVGDAVQLSRCSKIGIS
jgi:hypothetical protein